MDQGTPVERYLAHVDTLSGGLEPQFWPVGEAPWRVTAIGYRDVPEPAARLPEGGCRFSYGDTIDFGEPITDEGALDGFVVFDPIALDAAAARIQVDDGLPVVITGLYPTHASERAFIAQHGLEAFWKLDWDPYDVTRPPVV